MLRRLRSHRRFWAALAAGLLSVPSMLGGVGAAPAESADPLPPPEPNPLELAPLASEDDEKASALSAALVLEIADLAPKEFHPLVLSAAEKHQVDPRLIAAVITVETEWRPDAVGMAGERGLMQIMAETGAFLARHAGLTEYDLSDPETSVDLGTLYLSMLLREYGTPERALAAYNGGPRAVHTAAENAYVKKVFRHYRKGQVPAGTQASTLEPAA